jgi:nucleotide exchange factor SIL1
MVRDDQHLPPGLHVRMNWETGQKDAKLNEDSPINASDLAVVVEDDAIEYASAQRQAPLLKSDSLKPPPYSPNGKIPVPKDTGERELFLTNMAIINSINRDGNNSGVFPSNLLSALGDLEDLSHDLYYGVEIARDHTAFTKLVSFLPTIDNDPAIRAAAALVLGSALQNNPAALDLALTESVTSATGSVPLTGQLLGALSINEKFPKVQERIIYALNAVTRAPGQRIAFLEHGGMDRMREAFDPETIGHEGDKRDGVRGKVANFINDYFLDDLMFGDVEMIVQPLEQKVHGKPDRSEEDMLKPWCRVFGEAMKKWTQHRVNGGAYEKVEGAYMALVNKLGEC